MPADDSDSRGLAQALSVLWLRRGLIGWVTAVGTGLAALPLALLPPRYTAQTRIALDADVPVAAAALDSLQPAGGATDALGRRRMWVHVDAGSHVLRLGVEAEGAAIAARLANAMADRYVAERRQAGLARTRAAIGRLDRQITEARTALDAARQQAMRQAELSQAQRARAEAEAALARAQAARKAGSALPDVEESAAMRQLRQEAAQLSGRIAQLSVGYRDGSPALMVLRGQLAALRRQIDRGTAGQFDLLAIRVARAKAREDALRAASDASPVSASPVPAALEALMAQRAELANRADSTDARITARATAPAAPSFPDPWLFLGTGFAGALGVSASLVLLRDRFRRGFRTTRQVRAVLDLPTIGIVPRLGRPRIPADTVVDKPDGAYAEAVRSAQLALLAARGNAGGVVLVTSSLPGEGKTAFAVSLGRSLALGGRRVLLVDADLRRPAVAQQLDTYGVPGLADLLRQHASMQEVVRHDARSGLDFVPSGTHTPESRHLLEDPRLRGMLATWLAGYDVVLVDTPPVMVAFDAAVIADQCGMALYVVEWDHTPRRAVEAGIEHLKQFNVPVAGVVLSKVDLARQRLGGDYIDFCFRDREYFPD